MKKIKTEHAIGLKLLHDVTEVDAKRNFKGIAFKRGHIITSEDISKLKSIGKNYVFIEEAGDENLIHEDDASLQLSPLIAGKNVYFDNKPKEGKINFYSNINGLLKLDKDKIIKINLLKIPSFPTIHNNFPVVKNQLIAAFRIIPLYCDNSIIEACRTILTSPALSVLPYKLKKASIIVTGNEVYNGIIEDRFIPVIEKKLKFYNIKTVNSVILPDNKQLIRNKISEFSNSSDIIFITGGTSVDPDDVTREAMTEANVNIIQEGCPVQPGNNLTIGYLNTTPVLAIPAAAIYFKNTSLDIFLPRIATGERITEYELAEYSIGGLCHFCKTCVYPKCSFGK